MRNNTSKLVITSLFAAMITIMTAYIFHIPYGVNGGYVHFGDALIYLAAVFLPRPYALAAGALGAGLADIMMAPMWTPATVIIKMLIVIPFTSKEAKILTARNTVAPFLAVIISVSGYYIAEGILFGSFVVPMASVIGNVIQGAGSGVIFFLVGIALDKVHMKNKTQRFLHT